MNKHILIFVLLTVVVAAIGIGSAQAEDKLVEDGWVREYCLSQRNRKDMASINEIRDKRQYYTASKGLYQMAMRHKRQAENKEALTQEGTESETAQEDLKIYTEILQLEKYVNSVCQSFLENEDDSQ